MWMLTITTAIGSGTVGVMSVSTTGKCSSFFQNPTYFQCGVGGQVRVVIMYVPTRVAQHSSEMHASSEYGCMGLAIILNAGFPHGKKKLARVSEKREYF